jgi:ATP-dependent phosphofructokinase / diphosphate-dependent phosphofructokinase
VLDIDPADLATLTDVERDPHVPIPFSALLDPKTGRPHVRLVDIHSTRYAIARRYMIRVRRDDLEDPHELARFAATAGLSLEEFRTQFEYLIDDEPPPLIVDREHHSLID